MASDLQSYLRPPPAGAYIKSAYAAETSAWTPKGELEAVMFFRGAIVTAFGNIEGLLSEVAIRSSRIPECAKLRDSFPYSTQKRVSYLRRAFTVKPLDVYKGLADMFLDKFVLREELRHLIVHAKMKVVPGWGVTFYDYPRADKDKLPLRQLRMTIAQLEENAWLAARLSRLCQRLCVKLDQSGMLPPLD